jgi:hypothetical protein
VIPQRWIIVGVILAAQTVANIGPLGIPAIASLIRSDLGLSLTQAGSFLSAYYIGPILMSLPAGTMRTSGASRGRSFSDRSSSGSGCSR